MQWVKLGDYIEQCDERNSGNIFSETDVRGISTLKLFIKTKANLDGVSLSSYKIVREDEFAFVPDTSRRGDKMSLAFNNLGNPCIVSSISCVFKVRSANTLLPEYLYLWFCRPDFDRYARYNSWGSAREAFSYDEMCRIEIPLPSIDEQRVVVEAWRGLKNLKEQNEQMAGPLMDLCQSYLQELKHKYPLVEIGPYIEEVCQRNLNRYYSESDVRGISIQKEFIKTKARLDNVSVTSYKVVGPGEFAFNPNTARMGEKICVALNNTKKYYLVSAIYPVFKIVNENVLLSEYLQLFFKQDEFNRYARYHSWGSAREMFNFDDMCRVKIPLPPIEVQQAIVEIYNCARTSKYISEAAKKLNSDVCPALIRQIIGDNK